MSDDDSIARYKRSPRKGQFQPGRSGNPAGRPKGAKSLKACIMNELARKVTITEQGRARTITKREAVAIQLINKAWSGDPKGLAAIVAFTREFEAALPEARLEALSRPEDLVVAEAIIARIRETTAPPAEQEAEQEARGSGEDDAAAGKAA